MGPKAPQAKSSEPPWGLKNQGKKSSQQVEVEPAAEADVPVVTGDAKSVPAAQAEQQEEVAPSQGLAPCPEQKTTSPSSGNIEAARVASPVADDSSAEKNVNRASKTRKERLIEFGADQGGNSLVIPMRVKKKKKKNKGTCMFKKFPFCNHYLSYQITFKSAG